VLSSKELQAKTRQEILALGTQLGKANIAAWATKEEEEADAAKALKTSMELDEVRKSLHSSRAAAWEEAEQAKYAARYKREEAKIQAWENHEKAKAEAEMRRIEVILFCYPTQLPFLLQNNTIKKKNPCYDAFTLDVKTMLKMEI
jgi:hypothetical protein